MSKRIIFSAVYSHNDLSFQDFENADSLADVQTLTLTAADLAVWHRESGLRKAQRERASERQREERERERQRERKREREREIDNVIAYFRAPLNTRRRCFNLVFHLICVRVPPSLFALSNFKVSAISQYINKSKIK